MPQFAGPRDLRWVLTPLDVHADGAGAEQTDKTAGGVGLFRKPDVLRMAAPPEITVRLSAEADHILGQLRGMRVVDGGDRKAVLADQLGRDPLPDHMIHFGVIKWLELRVAVAVDKAGRQDFFGAVHHRAAVGGEEAVHLLDQAVPDEHIGEKRPAARPVIYFDILDQCFLTHHCPPSLQL